MDTSTVTAGFQAVMTITPRDASDAAVTDPTLTFTGTVYDPDTSTVVSTLTSTYNDPLYFLTVTYTTAKNYTVVIVDNTGNALANSPFHLVYVPGITRNRAEREIGGKGHEKRAEIREREK